MSCSSSSVSSSSSTSSSSVSSSSVSYSVSLCSLSSTSISSSSSLSFSSSFSVRSTSLSFSVSSPSFSTAFSSTLVVSSIAASLFVAGLRIGMLHGSIKFGSNVKASSLSLSRFNSSRLLSRFVLPVRTAAFVIHGKRIFVGFRQDVVEIEAKAWTKPADLARIIATPNTHMQHLWTTLEGVRDAVTKQTVPWIPRQSLLHPDGTVRIYGIQFHSLYCKKTNDSIFRRLSLETCQIMCN
ncbi:hypothetical protein ALC57_03124 [Trachymyrmex cornetzi]|uniref:Uncharacterized protein n=1 Tax=Trachymyrmex cornetzi TaxID=471704 RepID=A0A151JMD2_9HYME|nr:hypothetical protein ALC57_03124 [Trachymyrmex cornetzi]